MRYQIDRPSLFLEMTGESTQVHVGWGISENKFLLAANKEVRGVI